MAGLIEQERYACAIGALQTVVAIPRATPIPAYLSIPISFTLSRERKGISSWRR